MCFSPRILEHLVRFRLPIFQKDVRLHPDGISLKRLPKGMIIGFGGSVGKGERIPFLAHSPDTSAYPDEINATASLHQARHPED